MPLLDTPAILVVDDELDICLALQDFLESEGFRVDTVETGNEALRRIHSPHTYRSVILDLGLPDIDGLSVLQQIQVMDAALPVIILTAHGEHDEKIQTLENNAFAHLTKPYDRRELKAILQRAIAVEDLRIQAHETAEALTSSEAKRQIEHQRAQALLSESEQRLRLALQAGHMGIWDWDVQTNQLVWSDEMIPMFGLDRNPSGESFEILSQLVHPDDRHYVGEALRQALEQGMPFDIDHRILRPSGETRWINCKGQALIDRNGKPYRMVGTVQDITEKKEDEKRLRESQLFFTSIVENIPHMIFVKDAKDLRFLTFNKAGEELIGYSRETMIGKTDYDFFPDSEADFYTAKDREVLSEKQVVDIPEEIIHTKAQGARSLHTKKIPLLDEKGQPQYLLGISEDITDRLHQDQETARLAHQNELLLTSVGDGIYGLDLEGHTTFVNPAGARMLGYSVNELQGVLMHAAIHHTKSDGSPYPQEECPMYASFHDGLVHHMKNEVLWRKDGSCFPVEYTSTPILKDGKAIGAVVTFRDITERQSAEQALEHSEERFRQLSEAIPQQVWTALPDGSLDYVNKRVTDYFGRTSEEILGQRWQEVLHPDDLPECLNRWAKARDTGQPYEVEFRLLRNADQAYRWHLGRALPILNEEGQIIRWFGTNTDMTELKHLENQLRQTQKMEAIGSLAAGIAHDFNNILMAIMGYTELAKISTRGKKQVLRNLEEILIASQRGKELIQQILTFSRQSEQERQPLDIQVVIKEIMKLLRATLPTTIDIQSHVQETPTLILGNPIQIHQVIMNLCANAEHAMRETGGVLELFVDTVQIEESGLTEVPELKPGSYLRLRVGDSGRGMSAETIQHIFNPFFTTKGIGEGTGMGLAVVHGIVSSHGGAITVKSELMKGTIFTIYLPEMECMGILQPEQELDQELLMGRGYILYVEDEEPLARLGREALEGLGYGVMVRTSSVEALEAFRSDPFRFDAVITDQTMPNLTGEALARKLLEIRPDIPIILCTGFSHTITQEKAKALGIRSFLLKPLLIKDLGRVLRETLQP